MPDRSLRCQPRYPDLPGHRSRGVIAKAANPRSHTQANFKALPSQNAKEMLGQRDPPHLLQHRSRGSVLMQIQRICQRTEKRITWSSQFVCHALLTGIGLFPEVLTCRQANKVVCTVWELEWHRCGRALRVRHFVSASFRCESVQSNGWLQCEF